MSNDMRDLNVSVGADVREVSVPMHIDGLQALPPMIAVAVLIKRIGGHILIRQEDLDLVAGKFVVEGWTEDGGYILTLGEAKVEAPKDPKS